MMDTTTEGVELEVIVGTYEEFLLGYKLVESESSEGKKYKLVQSFTNHSHSGSIRSAVVIGKYLASGSTDEAIRLINMGARVEHGYMQQQTGTITCLANHGSGYLFSGCEDGTICIWKSGSWICEKTLKAHKGGVDGVSIHPSGKLALSIGKDRTLKTWNLIKGRTGFVTNLHGVGDSVKWSPDGNYYAVGIANRLDVYSIETAKVAYSIPFGKRVSCICFPQANIVVIAGDKETVEVHDIIKCTKLAEFKAHKVRVKGMDFVADHNVLVTGSNCDGFIKIWRFSDENCSNAPELLTEFDTTCRITCLTVWNKTISDTDVEVPSPEIESDEESAESVEEEKEVPPQKKKSKLKSIKSSKTPKSKPNNSETNTSVVEVESNLASNSSGSRTEPPRKKKKKSV